MFRRVISHFKKFLPIRKSGTLVYVGLHKGYSFDAIFRQYKICYGFEANPKLYCQLQNRFGKYPHVHIFNLAVSDHDGEVDFNISSNDGVSSSIGQFKESWDNYKSGSIRMEKTIRVTSINLLNFLLQRDVNYIDCYISDIQGLDLTVLKTLKPLIEQRKINTITCEVTKDEYGNIYKDIADNSERGFKQLLNDNYECVAKGWGILKDGDFSGVPEEWWEIDCKWKLKK